MAVTESMSYNESRGHRLINQGSYFDQELDLTSHVRRSSDGSIG